MTTSQKLWHIHCESRKDATKVLPVTLLVAGWVSQIFLQQTGLTDAWSEPWSKHAFLYLTFLIPPPILAFSDQSGFHAVGSASGGLSPYFTPLATWCSSIQLSSCLAGHFQSVWHRPTLHAAVHVDWTRPADACLHWLVDFFSGHSHHTMFSGDVSRTRSIIGQHHTGLEHWISRLHCHSSWSQTAQPRQHIHQVRWWYLRGHPCDQKNISTKAAEIDNIAAWAAENELKLN